LKQIIKPCLFICLLVICTLFLSCKNNSRKTIAKTGDSLAILTELIHNDPNNATLFSKRAVLFFNEKKLEEAIRDGEYAIKIDSLNSKYYIQLCEYYIYAAKSGKAKDILEKCNILVPNNSDILLKLSELYLIVKQYDDALKYLQIAEEIDKQISKIYFLRGIIYKEKGDTLKSINNFRQAIDINSAYYEAYILLGLIYYNRHDSLAVEYYKAAIRLKPGSIEAHYNLAMFYQENRKEKKAIDEYNVILKTIDSTYIYAWYNIGYINLEYLKKYNQAIPFFTKAIELDTNYVDAIYNRGYCYEKLQYYQIARDAYRKCNRIVPNYELAINGLNRLP
jgi:tetratricopeptide (TPR) repeat protein